MALTFLHTYRYLLTGLLMAGGAWSARTMRGGGRAHRTFFIPLLTCPRAASAADLSRATRQRRAGPSRSPSPAAGTASPGARGPRARRVEEGARSGPSSSPLLTGRGPTSSLPPSSMERVGADSATNLFPARAFFDCLCAASPRADRESDCEFAIKLNAELPELSSDETRILVRQCRH
jgi:hypothetical protein